MNMTNEMVRASCRLAGGVKRYHTWPTLTEQGVGEHSFHILRIFYQIWGPDRLTPAVSSAILWHDLGEIATGDVPFQVKAKYPQMSEPLTLAEQEKMDELARFPIPPLTGINKWRVKICDILEMYEFGLHELMLGNQYAHPIINDTQSAADSLMEEHFCSRDRELVLEYVTQMLYRMGGGRKW